jgi:hypothetical protein
VRRARADAFVQVGQAVKQGDTLCIIEAMKLSTKSKPTSAWSRHPARERRPVEFGEPCSSWLSPPPCSTRSSSPTAAKLPAHPARLSRTGQDRRVYSERTARQIRQLADESSASVRSSALSYLNVPLSFRRRKSPIPTIPRNGFLSENADFAERVETSASSSRPAG